MIADRALFSGIERMARRLAIHEPAFGIRQAKAMALMLERYSRKAETQARAYLERDDRDSAAAAKDARDEYAAWASRLRAIVDHHSDRPSEDKAVGDDPTPQTKRKLRRDPVETLRKSAGWHPSFENAAREIEEIHVAFERGPRQGVAPWLRVGSGGECTEYLTERAEDILKNRYEPWEREMAHQPAVRGNVASPLTKLDVALFALIDGIAMRDLDSFYLHADYGTAKTVVLEALDRYCEISGTRDKRKPSKGVKPRQTTKEATDG